MYLGRIYKMIKDISVKFNFVRWLIFVVVVGLGGIIGDKIINISYVGSGIGGLIFGTITYFFFYLNDKIVNMGKYYTKEKNSKLLNIYLVIALIPLLVYLL